MSSNDPWVALRITTRIRHHSPQQIISKHELVPQRGSGVQSDEPDTEFRQEDMNWRKILRQVHCPRTCGCQRQDAEVEANTACMGGPTLPRGHRGWQDRRSANQSQAEQNRRKQQYHPTVPRVHLVKNQIDRIRFEAKWTGRMGSLYCGRRWKLGNTENQY